uniref:T5orf172 domain-containing protein n=1 Tax=Syphacia muris TaxID=451379 RepID=A0A0N5A876_9BILA
MCFAVEISMPFRFYRNLEQYLHRHFARQSRKSKEAHRECVRFEEKMETEEIQKVFVWPEMQPVLWI